MPDKLEQLTREQAVAALKEIREILFPADDVDQEWDSDTPEQVGYVIQGLDPDFDKPETRAK
jgi:hypothetical protein